MQMVFYFTTSNLILSIYEDLLRRAFNLQDVVNSYNSRDKYFLDLTLLMKRKIAWTFKKRKENALTPYLSKLGIDFLTEQLNNLS